MSRRRQVATSRTVPAERQVVFDLLADPAMHPVLDGSGTVVDARPGGPQRLSLGARFGMDMRIGAPYRILNTVVEFEEGRRIAWRHFHGHRWRYELEDEPGGGTRVTETFDWSEARTRLPLELAGIPRRNLRAMRRTLANLERHVGEQREPTA